MWIDIANGITGACRICQYRQRCSADAAFRTAWNWQCGTGSVAVDSERHRLHRRTRAGGGGSHCGHCCGVRAMSFAPTAYSTGSSLLNTIGNIAIGGNSSGAPGGTFGGITVRNLMGALTPTSLIKRRWVVRHLQGRTLECSLKMQSTAFRWLVSEHNSPQRAWAKIGQTLDGAGVGIWATLKKFQRACAAGPRKEPPAL